MGSFNSDGYSRERLDAWVTKLKDIYYSIFGANIDLSADTLDGQLIGALAEALSNEDQKAEAVYKAFNPAEAVGVPLSSLVRINGINRKPASFSSAELTLTGTDGTLIPTGSIVRNPENDESFVTISSGIITGGTATVSSQAVNSGPVISVAGSITAIDSNISGWETVTNNNDAIIGESEETDAQLRERRSDSVAISSVGNIDSVYAAVSQIDDVTSAVVRENATTSTDADGIPAHSIAVIVQGGSGADIIEAIYKKKSAGCGTYGALSGSYIDSQNYPHIINYDRPDDIDIYIDIVISAVDSVPSGIEDVIKEAVVNYFETDKETRLRIGDDVIHSQIYIPVMASGSVSITSITVGTTASPTGTTDVSIAFDELARFNETRIDVQLN